MLSIVLILLPIFALILAGYLVRHFDLLGPQASSEINRFVVWLALPAVLFDIMANTSWHALYQPAYFLTFLLANLLVFGMVLVWQLCYKQPLTDAGIVAMTAAYPNVGFIGFPLMLAIFGKSSLMPTTIATIIVACLLFALAICLIEAGMQVERHPVRLAAAVLQAVIKNPLILAPLAGLLCSLSGITLPISIEQFLKLLAAAASPCALVCIGLFLADQSRFAQEQRRSRQIGHGRPLQVLILLAIKLVLQPALSLGLVNWLIPPVTPSTTQLGQMAVLLAALPTGTGPFMLAEYYRRDGGIASKVILWTTIASIASLAGWMVFLGIRPL